MKTIIHECGGVTIKNKEVTIVRFSTEVHQSHVMSTCIVLLSPPQDRP